MGGSLGMGQRQGNKTCQGGAGGYTSEAGAGRHGTDLHPPGTRVRRVRGGSGAPGLSSEKQILRWVGLGLGLLLVVRSAHRSLRAGVNSRDRIQGMSFLEWGQRMASFWCKDRGRKVGTEGALHSGVVVAHPIG